MKMNVIEQDQFKKKNRDKTELNGTEEALLERR
jgi:hypothetical protein